MLVAVVVMRIQTTRERDAGFTWLPDTYANLPQIDPVSRYVIRAAGEDYLSSAERKKRIDAVRQSTSSASGSELSGHE